MDPHFAVRFFIVALVLIYVVVPMLRERRDG